MDLNKAYLDAARNRLNKDILKFQDNPKEKLQIQTLLNNWYNIQNNGTVDSGILTPEDYKEIRNYVAEVTKIGVDNALRATPANMLLTQKPVDDKIQPLKFEKKLDKDGTTGIVYKHKLDKVLERIRALYSSSNKNSSFINEVNEIEKELKGLETNTSGRGTSYKMTSNLVTRLNRLYSQLNVNVLTQKIGDIGEYFSGAVLAAANAKMKEGATKITNELLKSLPKNAMNKLGDETSYHFMAQYNNTSNGVIASTHATQDKVDMEVELLGQKIPLSVKNYQNISLITIFKGNLLTLLSSNQHYNNLLRSYSVNTSTNDEEAYQLLKKISFVKALGGGVLAQNSKGEIIQTGKAKYFVVNEQGKAWHVWSIREIIDKFELGISKFEPDFPKPDKPSPLVKDNNYVSSAFSSHISLLTKSLKAKN